RFDLGFGDGGNIVKVLLAQFLDLRPFDHAPVSHKGDALTAKALDRFADLRGKGFGVAGVADKDLNGQGPPLSVAEQADDDLLFARLAVAVVAPGRQGVMVAFQIAAGDIIEEKIRTAVGMKMGKELLFDQDLILGQPSQVGVKLIFVKRFQPQDVTGGMGTSQTDGAEAGALVQGASDDLPQGQGALAVGTQGGDESGALGQLVQHPDGTETKPLAQMQRPGGGGVERVEILFMLEGQRDGVDFLIGAGGKIGDGAVFDFALLPEGLAEQDAVIGLAVDRDFGAVEIHSEHNIWILLL